MSLEDVPDSNWPMEEEPEEVEVRVPPPEASPGSWVRTSEKGWTRVDERGIDPKTGEVPVPWVEGIKLEPPKLTKFKPKTTKGLSPKFVAKPSVVDVLGEGDPNGELWCQREPLASYQWARTAYITATHPIEEISAKTGWPRVKLDYWIRFQTKDRDSWLHEKRAYQNRAVYAILKTTKQKCVETVDRTLDVIATAIDAIDDEQAFKMTPKDISLLVGVASELHRIGQLEGGNPTDIIARTKLTKEKVLERLKSADIISYEASDTRPASPMGVDMKSEEVRAVTATEKQVEPQS